ncbi:MULTISPECIES: ammonia-forming cytochrome c nitrite reductase subunit c552 [unclassified Campylobacter]|uniref:ammonia-forming cytochrome c nitrite reductase subunit c552 n=1 Tax=unclassified Campylobacter TaxID=2593542 RepID=UPI0022E9BC4F|nr:MULTISPECIES: ammonia-forming cytochrome c nitrite reductase subunit c552 [unclassified Campylobacter]MDA3053833.1 cytochrome c family protein [Campylobacter sp. VBCF_07 NA4]MDA3060278.1 cytochrome c family protein [Campylobacter sp. VBCF_02 NA5]MDA3061785.1 cytochrome c family protein [Campylobacter sp. JMF_14 EL1]MDA3069794.1 cytochrome c family protein [Campylobacter sp. VBCF_08 NA3]MDA3073109.1 cytochrome c family protein [Campylobacter sp. JMF_10 EL2]
MRFKFLGLLGLGFSFLFAAEADFADPNVCATCHSDVHEAWVKSLHALSHEDSNELYKKSISLIAKETGNLEESLTLSCGQCHNAKMKIKELDVSMSVALSLDLGEKDKVKEFTKSEDVKNGISCYICHNVDKIKPDQSDPSISGYKSFSWSEDYVTGPYDVSEADALYHQSQKRDFFQNNDELCNSCHQGQGGKSKLSIYNTQAEGAGVQNAKLCVDCHMGKSTKKIIAPGAPREGAVIRDIRSHFFNGARNSDILKEAIELRFNRLGGDKAVINLKNLTTHKVPTGFSGRSVEVHVRFKDRLGKILSTQNLGALRAIYTDSRGDETLSYAAKTLKEDTRLNAGESREFSVTMPQNTYTVDVKIVYYVLAPQLQNLLKVKDESFTKPYEIIEITF